MNARKALELLESGREIELRKMLQNEIYEESLNSKTGARKRYTAMKKYFGYHKTERTCLQKPCQIKFENKDYISFTNAWSLVLTTESCGELELFTESDGRYPDVTGLINFDGIKKKIDFNKVIAEAKSKGYRLNKTEVGTAFKYLMFYDGGYYKIGLLDATLSIIDDGEIATTYHPDGERTPLTIQTSLGVCVIMPVKFYIGEPEEDGKIVITVE